MIRIECSHCVAAVGPPKQISSRWLGPQTVSWQSAPNHDSVLAVYTLQEPRVPSGGSRVWITDMICFASPEGAGRVGGWGPSSAMCWRGRPPTRLAGTTEPRPQCRHPSTLGRGRIVSMRTGYSLSGVDLCWDHLNVLERIELSWSWEGPGFWFLSFSDIPRHLTKSDDCRRQRQHDCLAPEKILSHIFIEPKRGHSSDSYWEKKEQFCGLLCYT